MIALQPVFQTMFALGITIGIQPPTTINIYWAEDLSALRDTTRAAETRGYSAY